MSPESTEKIYITNLPIALSEISFTDKSVKKMSLTLELIWAHLCILTIKITIS